MNENNRVSEISKKWNKKLWRAVEKEMKTKNCRAEYAKQTSWNVCEQPAEPSTDAKKHVIQFFSL